MKKAKSNYNCTVGYLLKTCLKRVSDQVADTFSAGRRQVSRGQVRDKNLI